MLTATTTDVTTYIVRDGVTERVPARGYWSDRPHIADGQIVVERKWISPARFPEGAWEIDMESDAPCPTDHADVRRIDNSGHLTMHLMCFDCLGDAIDPRGEPACTRDTCWCRTDPLPQPVRAGFPVAEQVDGP